VEFLIVMVLVLVVLYVLTIRPQRQRQQAQQTMIDKAGVGDDILTNGGIYGTIVETEGDDMVVEIADGLNVHMTRRGIAAVLPPEDEEDEAEEVEEDVLDAENVEDDEDLVTSDVEAVTNETNADTAAAERR
jgi:preprotein translocase subunit YajC